MAASRTVNDLLKDAFLECQIVNAYEALSADDAATGLRKLQDLLAEWVADGITVLAETTEYFALVVAQEAYTVGESGSPTLNTARPEKIVGAWVRDSSSNDYPVNIVSPAEYRAITQKSTISGRPNICNVEYTAPNLTINVYPSPDAAESFYFDSIKQLTEPSALTENVVTTTGLPRNYYNALKYNLALDLSMSYGKEVSGMLAQRAAESLRRIKNWNLSRNHFPTALEIPSTYVGGNILTR